MTNIHRLARTWRYLLTVCCVELILIFLFPVIIGLIFNSPPKDPWGFVWSATLFGGVFGSLVYVAIQSKIITSPEKIEWFSFGVRVEEIWNNVEKLIVNRANGSIELVFKVPVYKKGSGAFLLRLGYDARTLYISSYIDDSTSSNLLDDIARYMPRSDILEFNKKYNRKIKTYQKAEVIGLYYLVWLFPPLIAAVVVVAITAQMEALQQANFTLGFGIMWVSLLIALFVNGLSLITLVVRGRQTLGYSAKIINLPQKIVAREARSHYLSPLVSLLLGFLVGFLIWVVGHFQSTLIADNSLVVFVSLILGGISFWVSRKLERLIFRGRAL